ncbi:MAG: acyl-CoA dehydrogenase, partial [Beijerinckiaceae bacterium]|nr:acyl-CoA dehydrogenase [Beijerinckiaceae bacterium]
MSDVNNNFVAVAEGANRFARAMFGTERARALMTRDHAGRDDEALHAAGAQGWLSLLASEAVGGAGQGFGSACAVAEAFARSLAPMSYASLATVAPILESMKFARLDDVMQGDIVVACVIRAVGQADLRINADEKLSGVARGVFWGGAANYFLVHADNAEGSVLALISGDASGVSVVPRRTVDGLGVADVRFDNSPVECVLQGDRAANALSRMRASLAILSAAELIGVSQTALDLTLEHLKTRHQFGRPLASFQALQFRAVDAYAGLALARALTEQGARLLDRNASGADAAAYAARAKAADAAMFLHRAAVQMHGAIGFSDEHTIGLCLKRALSLGVAWGNSTQWRLAVTRASSASAGAAFRTDTATDADFRSDVREWIAANLPDHLRHLPTRPSVADALWWHRQLYERGWIAPSWPKEYGGMGARVSEQIILYEEMGTAGAPEISGQAIYHFGPILQIFGSPEQKARF